MKNIINRYQVELMEDNEKFEPTISDWIFFTKGSFCRTPYGLKNYARAAAGILFLLAILNFLMNIQVEHTKVLYASGHKCVSTGLEVQRCSADFQIAQDVNQPLYVLYFISNIYINHKKYLESYSAKQLAGMIIDADEATRECYPIIYNRDLPVNTSWGGQPLDLNAVANPCGLKPMLYFNDTFKIYDSQNNQIKIQEQNVARTNPGKFKSAPESEKIQWINPQSDHFVSYMMTGSLMTKKRLWGKISSGLKAGNYTLVIQNHYQLNGLEIHKGIELTSTTAFGGQNFFFFAVFLLLSIMCLIYSFFVKYRLDQFQDLIEEASDKKQ